MKKLLYYFIFVLAPATIANAQCNTYYVFQEGSEWEYESYNAKGKLAGKSQQKVSEFSNTASGYTATVSSRMFDDKGKEVMKGDMLYKCDNGTMYLDMRNFISAEQMKVFSDYEMKIEATDLEFPSTLSAGTSLKDGNITISASGTPFPMKMTMAVTDRKVEGKESVTTPAGTFDCYKVTSTSTMENQMGMKMTIRTSAVEWIAPKVGMVRSESYDKNGKLAGYTVLSKRIN